MNARTLTTKSARRSTKAGFAATREQGQALTVSEAARSYSTPGANAPPRRPSHLSRGDLPTEC